MIELPVCRWRGGEVSPGHWACSSTKLMVTPVGVSTSLCQTCYCCDHEPIPRAPQVEKPRKRGLCQFLGGLLSNPDGSTRQIPCTKGCLPGKMLDLFGCSHEKHNGQTTQLECQSCHDYVKRKPVPRPVPLVGATVRNLIYHVYPVSGNGTWQRNVLQLMKRIDLFNGRRVIAIGTGRGLDPPEEVQRYFRNEVEEWIITPNTADRREAATFVPLLLRVRSADPNQVTFYGHAKGVTRPVNPGTTVHRWAQIMYETCLDYWPLVERVLSEFPLAGTFKKLGRCFHPSESKWHYSGTFFWFRNKELFSRPWPQIDPHWWGSESYLGLHFDQHEAGSLFVEGWGQNIDVYDMGYMRGRVLPYFQEWKKQHEHDRTKALITQG